MISDFRHRQNVMVLHAEPIVSAGLAATLEASSLFDVTVGEGSSREGCVPAPDVVVSDYTTGLRLASDLRAGKRWAPLRVGLVVLTGKPREVEIHTAIAQGVLGYLVTGCGLDELTDAVQAAAGGRRFLCRSVAHLIASTIATEALTRRERDVLRLLARGHCNKAIAARLDIAVGTVKAHVRGVMGKLNAVSRTEAASIASSRGLLEDTDALSALQ